MGILDGGQVAREKVEGQMGSAAGFKPRGDGGNGFGEKWMGLRYIWKE